MPEPERVVQLDLNPRSSNLHSAASILDGKLGMAPQAWNIRFREVLIMRAYAPFPSSVRSPFRLLFLLVAVLFCGFLMIGQAVPASAHDAVLETSPSDGETVAGIPATVSIAMDEEPSPIGAKIQVLDPSGEDRAEGEPQIEGRSLVQKLDADAPTGTYTVQWRLVSSDGHPTEGNFRFTVTAGSVTAPVSPGSTASASDSAEAPVVGPSGELTKPSSPAATTGVESDSGTPVGTADNGIWIIVAFAVVAAAMIVWLAITARRRQNQQASASAQSQKAEDQDTGEGR